MEMFDPKGPIDDAVLTVGHLYIKYRGGRLNDMLDADKKELVESIALIRQFSTCVGMMVTTDARLIEDVFNNIMNQIRSRVGIAGKISGRRLISFLFFGTSRGMTISGRLYMNVRTRVRKQEPYVVQGGTTTPIRFPAKFEELIFSGQFQKEHCSMRQRGQKRMPDLQEHEFCKRGCEMLLLRRLGFRDQTIGRIFGLKRTTANNRLTYCTGVLGRRRNAEKVLQSNLQVKPKSV